MISRSAGWRVIMILPLRIAARSTPMMGTDRSTLSRRTILFLLVLLGAPLAAHSATLEDSAKELARKIAAALPMQGELACDFRNVSSLELDEVVRIEQTVKTELQNRCARTQANGSEAASIVVTLSENVKSFVWTAEIRQGGGSHEILQVVPHAAASHSIAAGFPIVLSAERFWDGPERILDAGIVGASNGDQLVILLLTDAVLIQNVNKTSEHRIDIPLVIPAPTFRESAGNLYLNVGNILQAVHERRNCTISLDTSTLIKCEDYKGPTSFGIPSLTLKGGQVVPAAINCVKERGVPWFVTGYGDDTQADFLQVVLLQNWGSAIASNQVIFPGPVLAIHDALSDTSNTIIVKNPHTRNYEAYRLSISCRP